MLEAQDACCASGLDYRCTVQANVCVSARGFKIAACHTRPLPPFRLLLPLPHLKFVMSTLHGTSRACDLALNPYVDIKLCACMRDNVCARVSLCRRE